MEADSTSPERRLVKVMCESCSRVRSLQLSDEPTGLLQNQVLLVLNTEDVFYRPAG